MSYNPSAVGPTVRPGTLHSKTIDALERKRSAILDRIKVTNDQLAKLRTRADDLALKSLDEADEGTQRQYRKLRKQVAEKEKELKALNQALKALNRQLADEREALLDGLIEKHILDRINEIKVRMGTARGALEREASVRDRSGMTTPSMSMAEAMLGSPSKAKPQPKPKVSDEDCLRWLEVADRHLFEVRRFRMVEIGIGGSNHGPMSVNIGGRFVADERYTAIEDRLFLEHLGYRFRRTV